MTTFGIRNTRLISHYLDFDLLDFDQRFTELPNMMKVAFIIDPPSSPVPFSPAHLAHLFPADDRLWANADYFGNLCYCHSFFHFNFPPLTFIRLLMYCPAMGRTIADVSKQ